MRATFLKLPFPLILASASPRRAELLRELGFEFRVVPNSAPEVLHEDLTAHELCRLNAWRKARGVARQFPDALVLGADTLVGLGGRLFGKPGDRPEAARMLRQLQGRTHQVVTGVCLIHRRSDRQRLFTEVTDVTFRPLTAARIDRYLSQVNPLDKAGAYAIQEHGEMLVQAIFGSFSNVVGLPVERLQAELKAFAKGRPAG
jgi:septum formation protein